MQSEEINPRWGKWYIGLIAFLISVIIFFMILSNQFQ